MNEASKSSSDEIVQDNEEQFVLHCKRCIHYKLDRNSLQESFYY